MYTALLLYYRGDEFYGVVKQPGLPTVQGEIERALERQGISVRVRFTSRTDKGVSALMNVAFYRGDPPNVGLLNNEIEGIGVWGLYWGNKRPKALSKTYLYVIPQTLDPDTLRLHLTESLEWEGICKEGSLPQKPKIFIENEGELTLVWFESRAFCWQMIRRAVGYAMSAILGRPFRLAPPNGLALIRTETDVKFHIKPKWLDLLRQNIKKFLWKFTGAYGLYKGLITSLEQSQS